jgi:hypothetical protein
MTPSDDSTTRYIKLTRRLLGLFLSLGADSRSGDGDLAGRFLARAGRGTAAATR